MDDWPLEMVNSSDDWSGGVEFTYTLLALKGTHYYYFFAENILGGNTTLKNATGEPFTFNVTETEPGWVLGKITDSDGNNVSGVKLVIYSTKLNENGVTVLDEYFNTTTDAYGCYMKWLPISKYNYVIRVNERWLKDNGYTYATPGSGTFLIDYDHEMQWMNFTLEKPEWIHACLMGNVGDLAAQNSLSGVKISIGVFVDVKSQENMAIEGVNIIVNVTTRSWMNLTAVTDENGSFTITRVPFSTPAPGDLTIAAIRKYIHGIDTVPMPATPGRWRVTASKTGYEDHIETLRFSRAKTTWWNISMGYTPEPEKFNITGRVSPSRVVVTIDGAEVEVDPLTGIFIIENLSAGSYTLGFAADGYVTQYRNVTIIDSDMDIGEIRWPPPPPPRPTRRQRCPWR